MGIFDLLPQRPELPQKREDPNKGFAEYAQPLLQQRVAEQGGKPLSPIQEQAFVQLLRKSFEEKQNREIKAKAEASVADYQQEQERAAPSRQAQAAQQQAQQILARQGISTPQAAAAQQTAPTMAEYEAAQPTRAPATGVRGSRAQGLTTLDKLKAATAQADKLAMEDAERIRKRIADLEKMPTGQSKAQRISKAMAGAADLLTQGEGQNFMAAVSQFDADTLTPKEKVKLLQRAERDLTAAKSVIPQREMELLKQQLGYEMGMAKIQASRENALLAANKSKALGSEEKKQVGFIHGGYAALQDMKSALDKGAKTYSFWGDNEFTEARTRMAEMFGRMQSGGAISKDEEKRFLGMLPKFTDSDDMRVLKLNNMMEIMEQKAALYGVSAQGPMGGMAQLGQVQQGLPPDRRASLIQSIREKEKFR